MTDEQKEEIKEELKTVYKYDMFIDENPDVQERVERGIAQGRAEGRAEGMQRLILDAAKDRFPALADQAQPLIEQIQDTESLATLFRHLLTATNEREVRRILQIQEKQ